MANTIAKATGGDATREKTATRLGSRYASAQANTWRTFATVTTQSDGSVRIEITRDGTPVLSLQLSAETAMYAGGALNEVQLLLQDAHFSQRTADALRSDLLSGAEIQALETA